MSTPTRLAALTLAVLVIVAMAFSAAFTVDRYTEETRGIAYGPSLPSVPNASVAPYGTNADLYGQDDATIARSLDLLSQAGFRWVRQPFHWRDVEPTRGDLRWDAWDKLIDSYRAHDLEIIAVLDQPPAWARLDADIATSPPRDVDDYTRFVAAFVERYRDRVDAVQIWDEPNIFPHWGNRWVDPSGYAALLKDAYAQVKRTNPACLVLTAGLAPNLEPGGINMSDVLYLAELYRLGARGSFDVLAAKPYGMWTGPGDRRADKDTLNFSRVAALRQVMMDNGDAATAIWAVEFGWNALPSDWSGKPSPWGQVSEQHQAEQTGAALLRARDEWPWMGVMCLQGFLPWTGADDPAYGFSIVDRNLSPRPVYHEIARLAQGDQPMGVGYHYVADPRLAWAGAWTASDQQNVGTVGSAFSASFVGTRLDLLVRTGPEAGRLSVTIDDQPANRLPVQDGIAVLDLTESSARAQRAPVASGLADGVHRVAVTVLPAPDGAAADQHAAIKGIVVVRDPVRAGYFLALVAALGVALLSLRCAISVIARPPSLAERLRERWMELSEPTRRVIAFVVGGLGLAGACLIPDMRLAVAAGVLALAVIWLDMETGLVLIVFSLPFYLGPFSLLAEDARPIFSPTEVLIILCTVVWAARYLFEPDQRGRFRFRPTWLDVAVALFVVASLVAVAVAAQPRASLRELRLVLLEPVIFYYLVVTFVREQHLPRLFHALLFGAAVISVVGMVQYFFLGDVITAEGVLRMKALYGSPNNLSLFLGRAMPLAACLALWSGRRWPYLIGLGLMLIAQILTFSIGGWAALLIAALCVGVLQGRKALLAAGGAIAAMLAAYVPLSHIERFASHLDFNQGTTALRLDIWEAALNMVRDYPLLGVGLDSFIAHYPSYMLPSAWREPNLSHPHNLVLDFWLRLGIIGVAIILWLLAWFFSTAYRLFRSETRPWQKALALGLIASMVDFVAHGMIDNSYFVVDLAVVFWLSVATIRIMARERVMA